MENDSNSILSQSLRMTARLVALFAIWVTVLSFTVVTVTGRVISALSTSSTAAPAEGAAKPNDAASPAIKIKGQSSAPTSAKSNG